MDQNKYSSVEVILITAGGNSKTVVNYAKEFMESEEHNRKYQNHQIYLSLDCDDPKDILPVLVEASEYELLISNPLFEIWLLMYFEEVNKSLTKGHIEKHLSSYLHNGYKKADKGIISEIMQNGNVEKAIDNAMRLEEKYEEQGRHICKDVEKMNPYTSVHHLVEQFMLEIS